MTFNCYFWLLGLLVLWIVVSLPRAGASDCICANWGCSSHVNVVCGSCSSWRGYSRWLANHAHVLDVSQLVSRVLEVCWHSAQVDHWNNYARCILMWHILCHMHIMKILKVIKKTNIAHSTFLEFNVYCSDLLCPSLGQVQLLL